MAETGGLSATDIAAWVGAVSGIAAILWDFYKWKTAGPKLDVLANPGMKMLTPGVRIKDGSDYIMVKVRNTGTTKTTITALSIATYESWWARRRLRQSEAGVILQPGGHPIPYELDVGCEWMGAIKQNDSVNNMLRSGKLWCDVYHSWSKLPARSHVRPKPTAASTDDVK